MDSERRQNRKAKKSFLQYVEFKNECLYVQSTLHEKIKKKGVETKMKIGKEMLSSAFLKAEEIKEKTTATIISEGTESQLEFGNRITIDVKIGKLERLLTLNKTSANNIVAEYGDETKKWIGKKLELNTVTMLIRGKSTEVLIATPKTKVKANSKQKTNS